MPQIGGKLKVSKATKTPKKKSSSTSKRHFTVVIGSKEHGLYVSSSPSSAARKAVSKLCATDKKRKVQFHIREITQKSDKKTYGPYLGYIEKLAKPIELKGRVIRYKPVAKLSGKSSKKRVVKKGGMRGGKLTEKDYITLCIKLAHENFEKKDREKIKYDNHDKLQNTDFDDKTKKKLQYIAECIQLIEHYYTKKSLSDDDKEYISECIQDIKRGIHRNNQNSNERKNTFQYLIRQMISGETENSIYFISDSPTYNWMSNFFPCKFTDDRELKPNTNNKYEFKSTEQFFMFRKTRDFKAFNLSMQIMNESNSKKIKELGQTRFAGFNPNEWEKIKIKVMKRGLSLKFNQNEELKRKLIETRPKKLYEANKFDKDWGIGFDVKTAVMKELYDDMKNYGKNLLGNMLEELRDSLSGVISDNGNNNTYNLFGNNK
jgi:ribA/ribD-fused uncharacterized protein